MRDDSTDEEQSHDALLLLCRTHASTDKGKNGHLNPAFHLKVVGPMNKPGDHKGVSVCAGSGGI